MKIVLPDPIAFIPEKYFDQLRTLEAKIYEDLPKTQDEIISRIKDAEVITANYIDITPEIIDAAPNLKYIVSPAVGYDWIDVGYAAQKGIKVINCPTFVPLPVAEHAMAMIFVLAKRLIEASSDLRNSIWDSNKYVAVELAGKKLGLVGHGNIGKNLERMAQGMGLEVNYINSTSTPDDIDNLLKNSDFVCVCLPLNERTRHLIDDRRLKLLKKTAYLINVARGAIIDQKALIESLKRRDFAGAGLDVYEGEPGSPKSTPSNEILELVRLPNVVATPHAAFNTPEALDRKGKEVYENILACVEGNPKNIVN